MFIKLVNSARQSLLRLQRLQSYRNRNFVIVALGAQQQSLGASHQLQTQTQSIQNVRHSSKKLSCPEAVVFPVVAYEDVKASVNDPKKYIIDVRTVREVAETGKIPSSLHFPGSTVRDELLGDFCDKHGRPKPEPGSEIIFYCRAGIRAVHAAEAASKLGFTNIKVYTGSWLDWAVHEKLPAGAPPM